MTVDQKTLGRINKPQNGPAARVSRAIQHGDRPWNWLTAGTAVLVIALMVAIGWMLWQSSPEARAKFGWSFLQPTLDSTWDPVNGIFQAWPFIYGTLITSLVAIVIAVPLGLGIAIFLSEISPDWLRSPLGITVELLAAIPSVVFGLWGIFVFLPAVVTPTGQFLGNTLGQIPVIEALFSGQIPISGASRLAAGLILAIMIVPTVAAVSRDVLMAIPGSQREASLALGATRWETISRVLVPYGLSGILGAVILGLGRALGETMAVTMVIGNSIQNTPSLLRPGYTMSSVIANEFAEAVNQLHSEALIEVAFILFVITLLLNGVARFLVWRVNRRIMTEVRA
jgi:phosphate transport system permease protein